MVKFKPRKPVNVLFIVLFLVLLIAPALEQRFNIVPTQAVVEFRGKAPLPPGNPVVQMWLNNGYFPGYEKYFNDVFGFRDFFIRFRNQIQYSLFRESDQVIIGRNGWIADKPAIELDQRTVDALADTKWKRLSERMVHFNRILEKRGILLLILPIPIKDTVYPELFPEVAARRPAVTGYAKFVRLLEDDRIAFIDAYKVLSEKKRSVQVFYRTDLHWNTVGAAAVSEQAINFLGRAMHENVRWRKSPQRTQDLPGGGGEANSLAILAPIDDVEPAEYYDGPACGELTAVGQFRDFFNRCPGPLLPPTMAFGNSFMGQMEAAGFLNYFSRVYKRYDLAEFPHVLTEIKPGTRILIWQLFELEIGYQMQDDAWWREIDSSR